MRRIKGWLGEKSSALGMWIGLDSNVYHRFHDILVPHRSATTQVDHIVASKFGIFVLETKNYSGWIFGSEKQRTWTQVLKGKKSQFQNPLRQNFAHIAALAEHLALDKSLLLSRILCWKCVVQDVVT